MLTLGFEPVEKITEIVGKVKLPWSNRKLLKSRRHVLSPHWLTHSCWVRADDNEAITIKKICEPLIICEPWTGRTWTCIACHLLQSLAVSCDLLLSLAISSCRSHFLLFFDVPMHLLPSLAIFCSNWAVVLMPTTCGSSAVAVSLQSIPACDLFA